MDRDSTPSADGQSVASNEDSKSHGKKITPIFTKACENCRIRKIRCNKASPCSNCHIANLPCRPALKVADTSRSRVSAPAPYQERNFTLIHESLSNIKSTLRKLEQNASTRLPSITSSIQPGQTSLKHPQDAFQGNTSFNSHTVQATLSVPESHQATEIFASLSSLNDQTSSIHSLRFPDIPFQTPAASLDFPPLEFVVKVLKKANRQIPLAWLQIALGDLSMLDDICRSVYFPTKTLPAGQLALMNGLLMYLLQEYIVEDDPTISAADCLPNYQICEKSFCASIQTYECMVTPTLENIQSIIVGVMKAQEGSQPSLCWTLISAGARLCFLLGYHRREVFATDPPELGNMKLRAFWMLYMLDKVLSLNLGRVSNFPDHDIDALMYTPSTNLKHRPWDLAYIGLVHLSQILSQIYVDCCSAQARNASSTAQAHTIEILSSKLSRWHSNYRLTDTRGSEYEDDVEMIIKASDFIYYSCLTLLYGSQPTLGPTRISSRHFEVAKKSLQCHVQNLGLWPPSEIVRSKFYCDWVILYFSFTPYLIVFTHCIASQSQEDVEILSQALDALEPVKAMSESGDRLYQACSIFLRAAKAFILEAQQLSFGSFDSLNNSFIFPQIEETTSGSQIAENVGFPFGHAGYGFGNADVQQFFNTFVNERQL